MYKNRNNKINIIIHLNHGLALVLILGQTAGLKKFKTTMMILEIFNKMTVCLKWLHKKVKNKNLVNLRMKMMHLLINSQQRFNIKKAKQKKQYLITLQRIKSEKASLLSVHISFLKLQTKLG